jgi:hypothetical protein
MANPDTPRGLWPRRYLNGAAWNGKANRYYVPATDTDAAIYLGGLVKPAGSADSRGVMSVTGNVSTGNPVVGVVVAIEPLGGVGGTGRDATIYRANSTERYVLVADDPNLLFVVQDDGAAVPTAGIVANVADLTGFTSGSTVTGFSAIEISMATISAAGDATEDIMIFGLDDTPDNAIGINADWLVRLNNHFFVDGSAGA